MRTITARTLISSLLASVTIVGSAADVQTKTQAIKGSMSNLKQIGLAAIMYAGDHDEKFPPELTSLVKEDYNNDPKTFLAPLDSKRKPFRNKEIRPENTSYVYIGKGLTENDDPNLPLAFEKADIVARNGNGICPVLYRDGSVRTVKVRGKTNRAIAEELISRRFGKRQQLIDLAAQNDIDRCANLRQIGLAAKMYAGDHSEKFPPDLTSLVKEDYNNDPNTFLSPLDSIRTPMKNGTILRNNTSYAYVGKGLTENDDPQFPLAFEKADIVAANGDGTCAVLFLDGSVRIVKVKGKTNRAIAAGLVTRVKTGSMEKKKMIVINAIKE